MSNYASEDEYSSEYSEEFSEEYPYEPGYLLIPEDADYDIDEIVDADPNKIFDDIWKWMNATGHSVINTRFADYDEIHRQLFEFINKFFKIPDNFTATIEVYRDSGNDRLQLSYENGVISHIHFVEKTMIMIFDVSFENGEIVEYQSARLFIYFKNRKLHREGGLPAIGITGDHPAKFKRFFLNGVESV